MNLVPRNSLFDFEHMFEPSFLSHMWPLARGESKMLGTFSPRVDINEKEHNYEITAELPGVDKKDINVRLDNGILAIEAETTQESKEEEGGKLIRQERRYGRFYRSFDLGPQVQESDIHAEFANGVLKVVAPKVETREVTGKRIEIR